MFCVIWLLFGCLFVQHTLEIDIQHTDICICICIGDMCMYILYTVYYIYVYIYITINVHMAFMELNGIEVN